ncbi:VWA domain-containing protein [Okibacterium fritillariae]|uniref:VWA domain-containing protein n=1 Tax=Okibacterium fritillariae TaxID=123320 RepID=UPI00405561D5
MIVHPIFTPPVLIVVFGGLAAFALWQAARNIRRPGGWHWFVRLALVGLLFGMSLRPGLPETEHPPVAAAQTDVYFVLDTTSSMAAEDYGDGQPRLTGAKADIEAIADRLAGSRFSLITFDADTVQRLPLTTDASALASGVASTTQEISVYSRGSSIGAPAAFLEKQLAADKDAAPDRTRIVYYLGDGEQTVSTAPESFAPLADLVDGGAVLGYGTDEGGPMRTFSGYRDEFFGDDQSDDSGSDDSGSDGAGSDGSSTDDPGTADDYIQYYGPNGQETAISKIDEKALGTIAGQLGVEYVHSEPGSDVVLQATRGIDVGAATSAPSGPPSAPEFYWLLAIPFGLLLLTELVPLLLALRALRRPTSSSPAPTEVSR